MGKLVSLPLFDDGPPPKTWSKPKRPKSAKKKPEGPDVFPWKVRLFMNDGTTRFFELGRMTYAEAVVRRDELLGTANAYKAWLDRSIA